MSKERYEYYNEDEKRVKILEETEDKDLKVRTYNKGESTYILFDKKYNTPKLPEGFYQVGTSEKTCIKHDIQRAKLVNNDVERMSDDEIAEEITNINENLQKFVKSLKVINESTNDNIKASRI